MINLDVEKAIRSPVFEKAAEQAVQRFVQAGLDGLLERGHLDVKVKFSVDYDPKKGSFMALLSGTF